VPAARIRSLWDKARIDLRFAGGAFLLARMARRALAPVCAWRTLCYFERDLTEPAPEFTAKVPIETRVATPADLTRFHDTFVQAGARTEEFASRLDRGDLCFLGIADDRLVHFMWLCRVSAPVPAIAATVLLDPAEGLVYSSYTDPAARGRAIQPAVANFMIRHEQSLGLRRHFYSVLADNYAGRRIVAGTHARRTARMTRVVRCVRVAGLPGIFLTGLRSSGRPRLRLAAGVRAYRLGQFLDWLPGQAFDTSRF